MGGELRFDIYDHEKSEFFPLKQVQTWRAPISVRYFHPLGFIAGLTGTPVFQDVRRQTEFEQPSHGEDTFFLVDAAIGYRFPQRFGLASFEVRNLFDTKFKYQDDSFRESREAPPSSRFIPERTILGRLTLNF